MTRIAFFAIIIGIVSVLTSCIVQENFNSLQIEVLNPGKFPVPCAQRSIAVVNRYFPVDSIWVMNSILKDQSTPVKESFMIFPVTYSAFLANNLKKNNQFKIIRNFSSARNSENQKKTKKNTEALFRMTNTDLCICLDSVHIFEKEMGAQNYRYNSQFAFVQWSLISRIDSTYQTYRSDSTFALPQGLIVEKDGNKIFEKTYLESTCAKIAYSVATEISPKWFLVDRLYYHSKNLSMLQGEDFAKKNEWIKAAEIWRPKTEIRNKKLAAKACFNMAVVCEIEGKTDLAIDWVKKAKARGLKYNEEHQDVCKQYLSILELRKKEAAQLEIQMSE